ncbi:hypothetical protein [Paenibacillus sp. FSL H7-0326]|uniref:hypothetical protein n=2 Tax=Paenibacillus TaxID=44249 RepID=UPI0009F8CBE5|nr:hypothetical protein [Paenibacillus sp. FSL H7-0326]
MNLELRSVIYAKRVEIRDVPVFSCMTCSTYEVLKPVKPDLIQLISSLSPGSEYVSVSFADSNEVAKLITELLEHHPDIDIDTMGKEIEQAKQERINLLLDLYQYALSAGDEHWMNDVERRLEQLSQFRWEEHFSEAG